MAPANPTLLDTMIYALLALSLIATIVPIATTRGMKD